MNILAVETATEMCSVALWQDGMISERAQRTSTGHSDLILEMIAEVLEQAALPVTDCAAIAYGKGPGSFTALRIGVGIVQGIALGAGLPVIAVSSLQALAQRHAGHRADAVLAIIDARMGEIYWAGYVEDRGGCMQPITSPEVGPAAELSVPERAGWLLVGSGADVYKETLISRVAPARITHIAQSFPRAAEVAHIASTQYASKRRSRDAYPDYIRNRVTSTPK